MSADLSSNLPLRLLAVCPRASSLTFLSFTFFKCKMETASPACSLMVGNVSCSLASSQEVLPLTLKSCARGYLRLMKGAEFWCKSKHTIKSRVEEGRGEKEEKLSSYGYLRHTHGASSWGTRQADLYLTVLRWMIWCFTLGMCAFPGARIRTSGRKAQRNTPDSS